ncbi:DUF4142 domain-containing protein [Streptomyces sp. NBRC 110028]|uniref:DUF4142 domain-containing protein n=1 Tax=Streptomyces sp. NBRC 110028 TaxID=1621260 RepID=UPI000AFABA5D|nr:DUF4142 domain-containing protein [Streptomyces sp. NBRC 110028]
MRSAILSRSIASSRTIGSGLIIGALAVTLAAILIPVSLFSSSSAAVLPNGVSDDGGGTVSTQYGPLTPTDRDFVRKVKLAGLWELPSGRMGKERGTTEAVKSAAQHLIDGHTELNRRTDEVAQALGIALPTQPNDQQQGWLNEMTQAPSSAEFERLFAQFLRSAHGKVFNLVAQVRAQSKNSMVRSLATRANTIVLDHITALEDTGLVDYDAL